MHADQKEGGRRLTLGDQAERRQREEWLGKTLARRTMWRRRHVHGKRDRKHFVDLNGNLLLSLSHDFLSYFLADLVPLEVERVVRCLLSPLKPRRD